MTLTASDTAACLRPEPMQFVAYYVLYYILVARLGAKAASGVTYVPPVVALMIGYFSVGEPVGLLDVGAMVTILAGVGLLQSGRLIHVPEFRPASR